MTDEAKPLRPRVAIFGGDDRVSLLDWPRRLDVRHFPYKSNRAQERLENALASGSIDHLVLLTNYMGHSSWEIFRNSKVNLIKWPHSPMQLLREVDRVFPGANIPKVSDAPTQPTPRRIMVVAPGGSSAKVITAPTTQDVASAPSFASELARMLKGEGMSQSTFGRLVGAVPSTVCQWVSGKASPSAAYATKIVKLLPELAPLLAVDHLIGTAVPAEPTPPPTPPTSTEEVTAKWTVKKPDDEPIVSTYAPPRLIPPPPQPQAPAEERLLLAEELTRRWAEHWRAAKDLARQIRELMDSIHGTGP